jgi:regulator of protease activity HflC (stomatin/prohibitin superfamily)
MFRFIDSATSGVVQTFGKFTRVAAPGLSFYIPFIQSVTPVSNRLRQEEFSFEVKTKDDVFATLAIKVQYLVKPENSSKAFFSLEDPASQIYAYIENVVRSRAPHLTLNDLYQEQDTIESSVSEKLSGRMEEHGYTIANTLITAIDPAAKVKAAMNTIYESERLKVAAQNTADALYIKEVRHAEADSERKRLQGEGISKQRLAILKGYETGINGMADGLGLTPLDVVNFVMKTQHLDMLESIGRSENAKTVFLSHQPDELKFAGVLAKEIN